jgi:hypothetical protein
MNPAIDEQRPYLELVKDNRHRWSWVLWDADNFPMALSAISYGSLKEAAIAAKQARKEMPNAPTIFYTDRKAAKSGRYTQKSLGDI